MGRTLYISDLDGTLLNSQKKLSPYTIEALNELIGQQMNFSIATARTPATVEALLAEVKIKEPIVLLNGVALYSLQTHTYLSVEYIKAQTVREILERVGDLMCEGFIYRIHDDALWVYYENLEYKERRVFFEERQNNRYKHFLAKPLDSYEEVAYFIFIDDKEKIDLLCKKLKDVKEIGLVMYKDIYSTDAYILEVYSHRATKANAINKLRLQGGYDKVICFGDNLNDLSMFQVSEEAYAVENAMEEVKRRATAIIDANDKDGVVTFMQAHYKKEQ